MGSLNLSARIGRSFRKHGLLGALRHYSSRLRQIIRPVRLKPHPFDLRNGVHTTAMVDGIALATGHAHDIYNTCYLPSHPSMVTSSVEQWRARLSASDPRLEDFYFYDLGAGMGRVVMVASQYPFRQVAGIEMSPRLADQARSNLEIWLRKPHPCTDVQFFVSDATEYPWPRAPIVIYMFNPFEGPVIARLLESLERALDNGAGPVDILYVHPVHPASLEAHPRVRLIARVSCPLSEEDRAADPYNDPNAPWYGVDCAIYRLG